MNQRVVKYPSPSPIISGLRLFSPGGGKLIKKKIDGERGEGWKDTDHINCVVKIHNKAQRMADT